MTTIWYTKSIYINDSYVYGIMWGLRVNRVRFYILSAALPLMLPRLPWSFECRTDVAEAREFEIDRLPCWLFLLFASLPSHLTSPFSCHVLTPPPPYYSSNTRPLHLLTLRFWLFNPPSAIFFDFPPKRLTTWLIPPPLFSSSSPVWWILQRT